MVETYRLRVYKYLPERMYGFAYFEDTNQQVFFHLGIFDPGSNWIKPPSCSSCKVPNCVWSETSPPPVYGEEVDVLVDLSADGKGSASRANRVTRVSVQTPLKGTIKTFDNQRGYGFIECLDGTSHYVHKSDMIGNRIPTIGQPVIFFSGEKDGKTRACHVRLCV